MGFCFHEQNIFMIIFKIINLLAYWWKYIIIVSENGEQAHNVNVSINQMIAWERKLDQSISNCYLEHPCKHYFKPVCNLCYRFLQSGGKVGNTKNQKDTKMPQNSQKHEKLRFSWFVSLKTTRDFFRN